MYRDNARFVDTQRLRSWCLPLLIGLREYEEGGWRRLRMGHRLILLAVIIGLMAIGSQSVLAQQTASINGTVVDPSNAAIPGAELVLTNIGTGITRQTLSSAQGYFNFPGLSAAHYSLSVTAKGFETLNMSGLILNVEQQMTVQPVLQIGAARQVVSVTGAPPPVTTSSAALSSRRFNRPSSSTSRSTGGTQCSC